MSNIYLAWLLAGLWTFAQTHCISNYTEGHSQPSPAEVLYNLPHHNIVPGNVDFTFKFYCQVSLGEARNNILFSPLSISTALSMLLLGAKHRTQSQLLSGLSFNQTEISGQEICEGFNNSLHLLNDPSNEIELNLGNALFIDEEMKPLKKFVHDAKHFYNSDISHTNFKNSEQAEEQINYYIEKKTNGQFVDVIRGLETDVSMVLVNYMFMKAYWKNPFSFKNTREDYFFVDEQTTVRVPMMFSNALYKTYNDTDLSCQLVEIPYKGTTSALFILPEPGKMKQVEDALEKGILLKWLHSVEEQRINLHLPRFTIHAKYVLRGLLRRMGITDIFTDEADLSGITGKPELKVSKAVHQVHLSVHENGTEAAAAATFDETVSNSLSPIIIFNRPFVLIISESRSNSILFMGRIINPNGTGRHY
ncbi:alpha-1-antiproteinase-like [Anolis sagrei]|uniref:alpha-1-antiproteinase-like n=1 Tax=Anolis sagrei TaxID=38937 RepID=UPI00352197C4